MGSCCSTSQRCRYGNCQAGASPYDVDQGYCRSHSQQMNVKKSAPQYEQQYGDQQYQPPPPAYQPSSSPQALPSGQPPGAMLGCPSCQQPLIAPPNCTQMRCPRCQCVFALQSPAPAYYSPQYHPQMVVIQQPAHYNQAYGYQQQQQRSSGMGGLGTGLAVGGGLLGGLLLADMMF